MTKASDNVFPRFLVSEGGSTATPAAAQVTVYAKADGLLYSKDDAGVETLLSSGPVGSVATDTIWDTKGDLAAATGADAAAKLAAAANGSFLRTASGQSTGLEWQLNNLAAAVAPAVTDDSGDGYSVGSRWIDTTADKEYVCLDATVGAAVWTETTGGGGGSVATDAIWDAKGDLAGGTGANTAARLAVGANDTVLTADSAQATGLKWAAAAGGSGFDLDTYTLDATYGDDFTAASLNTTLWTRRNFAAGAETYQVGKVGTYIRIAMTGRAAGDGYLQTAPGGDWTFAMANINRLWDAHTWGVCVLDSAGTGLGTEFADLGGGLYALILGSITTYTTYGGTFQSTGSTTSLLPTYIRNRKIWQYLRKSGTDYFAAFSLDGETWSPETPAFSSAITVDRVGMIAHPQAALTTTAQVDVDWFNKIA